MGEELRRVITIRSLALTIIFSLIFLVASTVQLGYTNKPWSISYFVIPWLYIFVLNELLGRLSPRLRLTMPELVLMLFAFAIIGGHYYIAKGSASYAGLISLILERDGVFVEARLLAQDWSKDYWSFLPSFMFPVQNREAIVDTIVNGGVLDWGAVAPCIAWRSLVWLVWVIMGITYSFVIVGSRWIEVERLPYPWAIPLTVTTQLAGEIREDNKSLLFDTRDIRVKAYWIGVAIGFLGSILPIISQLIPPLAWAGSVQWSYMDVNLYWLATAFPGANATFRIHLEYLALWLCVSNDVLWTFIICQVVFNWIWLYTAVRLGIIPYERGMEFYLYGGQPGTWEPFPYTIIGTTGIALAIGVLTLWTQRDRLGKIWQAMLGKGEYEEHGLPVGKVAWVGVALTVLFIILTVAAGIPIIVTIVFLFLAYFLFWPSAARGWAEVCEAGETNWDVNRGWIYLYSAGLATGQWPYEFPNPNTSWAIAVRTFDPLMGAWMSYYWPLNTSQVVSFYKVAYENKSNMRDLYIGMIIIACILIPAGLITTLKIVTQTGGLTKTYVGLWGGVWQATASNTMSSGALWRGGTISSAWMWLIVGLLIGLGTFFAKVYIPGLPLNTTALYIALYTANLFWFDALFALVVKTLTIKAIGVHRWERIAMPLAAGICAGLGATYLFAILIDFFSVSLPKYLALLG
ncbi:MAG: hypothetical protein J7L11_05605 [Thermoprotei archaeon]|nr:hypothetical protein [Thermoprotei archaeon]